MRLVFSLILIVIYSFLLSACSDNAKPDKNEAVNQIQEYLNESDADVVADVETGDVEYLNGFSRDENNYVVAIKYEIVAKKSGTELSKYIIGALSNWDLGYVVGKMIGGVNVVSGESYSAERQFLFLKTEKGWINQGPVN